MFQTFWRRTGLIAFANAAALGLQFLTTILIAREFGASAQMDAYTLAVSIPESLQYVLMLATLSFVFTPLFIDHRSQHGASEAWSIALTLLLLVCGIVLILIPLLFLAMPTLMFALAPGFAPDTRALAVELSDLILPGLFYYATAGLLLGICYAYDDFTTAALNTLLVALLNLAAFFVLVQFLQWGVRGMMLGRLVALSALQIFLLARALRFKPAHIEKIRWRNRHVWRVLTYLPPYMFGAISWQIALVINRSLLSSLGVGSVAAWGYGQRLADIPLAVFGAAFGATYLPEFATHVSAQAKDAANSSWQRALARVTLVLSPVAAFTVALSVPLVTLVFQRGSFDERSTLASALVLAGLGLGLPTRAWSNLVVRGMPAFKSRTLPILLSALSTGTTILFDFLLIAPLGIFGIALATTLGDTMFALAGIIAFARWLGASTQFFALGKIVCAAAVAGIASALTLFALPSANAWLQVLAGTSAGGLVYLALLWVLDISEMRSLPTLFRARWQRIRPQKI